MSWNSSLGIWLVGGFIIYLIAANRMSSYLAIFNGTAVTYQKPASSGAGSGILGMFDASPILKLFQ